MAEVCPKMEDQFNFQFTRSCNPVCKLPIEQELPPPPCKDARSPPPKDKCEILKGDPSKDAARDIYCCKPNRRMIKTALIIMTFIALFYCFVYKRDVGFVADDPCSNGSIANNSYFNCYGRYYSKYCEQAPECPSDFQILRNDVTSSTDEEFVGCYLIVRTSMTWDSASAYCLERNASLLVIDSEVENIMIARAVYEMEDTPVTDAHMWLALRRQNDKCTCRLVWQPALRPQTELGYANWAIPEPNCHNNQEFCVAVHHRTYPQPYRWNDLTCWSRLFFVCEF